MKTRVFLTSVAIIATLFIVPNIAIAEKNTSQKAADTGEQSPAKTVVSKQYVDDTKQTKIPATSDGTNNTPNYVYDSTNNSTADGSVITTTGTAGTVSQRGIATEAIPDGTGGFTNGDWIPTVGAVMNAITSHVPSGTPNTVANYGANGALGTGIATANTTTYNATTGALENGANIATIAAVDTRQKKKVCAGYEPAEAGQPAHDGTHPGDEDYCWLWIFPD